MALAAVARLRADGSDRSAALPLPFALGFLAPFFASVSFALVIGVESGDHALFGGITWRHVAVAVVAISTLWVLFRLLVAASVANDNRDWKAALAACEDAENSQNA
jgi:hypothetical protein